MNPAVSQCPVCSNELVITRLTCNKCGTAIDGEFGHGVFSTLTDDESRFVELFVISRGNIKEMEKRLGISYPTVRNKLDSIIAKLQNARKPDPEMLRKRRREIIDSIKKGDLSPDEGAMLLEEL